MEVARERREAIHRTVLGPMDDHGETEEDGCRATATKEKEPTISVEGGVRKQHFCICRKILQGKKINKSLGSPSPIIITVLPLGIIAGTLCVMGNAQYYIHKAVHGRPKHIGNDVWDVAMERRDKKLMEMYSKQKN
ncbi:hypothetical protein NE237_002578 [Protea cynaroides]|uniref:NADH dehydrogenase [ubiquinone] 1 alpha subcomplex subunit 1 n=1 Tax=Protea cynaroides TaxID=273540 RepID=A0A9Q0QZH8_9MAGN|nr:hypothetical protein NE237_002578 [Protea cynaroides]